VNPSDDADKRPASRPKPTTNRDDIVRFLDLVMVGDGVVEVRAPGVPKRGTVTGYFDFAHKSAAVDAIASLSGVSPAVYCTLNPLNPDLLARAPNRLRNGTPKGEAANDNDVLRVRIIPFDFDWARPKGISSTDEEHEAALAGARACDLALQAEGIVPVLLGDSGNGGHLLLAVDLAKDETTHKLITNLFGIIEQKFRDTNPATGVYGYVKFDTSNSNHSRAWKCYGTRVQKGFHVPERPHRTARILALRTDTDSLDNLIASREQLENLVAKWSPPPKPRASSSVSPHHNSNYERWSERQIAEALNSIGDVDERERWLKVGMALHSYLGEAGRALWDSSSRRSEKYDEAEQEETWRGFKSNGGITIGSVIQWAKEGGWTPPRSHADNHSYKNGSGEHGCEESGEQQSDQNRKPSTGLKLLSLEDLLTLNLPPRKWLLEAILQEKDIAMVYAWRGTGKTWFLLQLAYALCSGGPCLRWKAPKARRVLYIDGEMPLKTMQDRMAAIVQAADLEPPSGYFQLLTPDRQDFAIPNLSTPSGQAVIEPFVAEAEVIIIDAISTLCASGRENDAESWLSMQAWALRQRRRGKSPIFVHHAGKAGAQRGTSKREDILDLVIQLAHPLDYSADQGCRFNVVFEKTRGIFGDAVKSFEAQLTVDPDEGVTWTMKDLDDAVFCQAVMLFNEGLTVRKVGEELSISPSQAGRFRQRAHDGGYLTNKQNDV
jgi:hypothetical protein